MTMNKLVQLKIFESKTKLSFSNGVRLGEKSPEPKFISEREHDVFLLKELFRSVLRHLYDGDYRLDIIKRKRSTNALPGSQPIDNDDK